MIHPTTASLEIPRVLTVKDSETLIVTFPGAVNRKSVKIPYFEWGRTLAEREESYLRLSDPTLELDDRLSLGWFIGSKDHDLHVSTAKLVEQVADEIGARKIVLVGSSGGGYAALAISAHVPGSIAVAFSPSTTIDRVTPGHTTNLIRAAFPEFSSYNELVANHPNRVSLEELYSTPRPNSFLLIQNAGDDSRLIRSFIPFAASLGLPPEGGTHRDGRKHMIVEPHGIGHIPPPKERFHYWLDVAVSGHYPSAC